MLPELKSCTKDFKGTFRLVAMPSNQFFRWNKSSTGFVSCQPLSLLFQALTPANPDY